MTEATARRRQTIAAFALGAAAVVAIGSIAAHQLSTDTALPPAPTQPHADPRAMIDGLEARMRETPGDVAGWKSLGQAYFLAGRYRDAAGAYARGVRLAPGDGELWSALGEAQTLAVNSVDATAHDSFARALAIDGKDARARYFLAVEKDVKGDHKGAIDDWIALLRDAPPGAPYAASVHQLVEMVAKREKIDVAGRLPAVAPPAPGGGEVAAAGIPGPTPEQMQAASAMTPSQQDAMARGMVDTLAARLAQNPKDAEGWIRLMRARKVLGDDAAASKALADGRRVFARDPATLARFADAARTLGIAG